MRTAGPAVWFATVPASVKMPVPMIPPTPIAVSCQRPSERVRPPSSVAAPGSASMASTGFRRVSAAQRDVLDVLMQDSCRRGRAGRVEVA